MKATPNKADDDSWPTCCFWEVVSLLPLCWRNQEPAELPLRPRQRLARLPRPPVRKVLKVHPTSRVKWWLLRPLAPLLQPTMVTTWRRSPAHQKPRVRWKFPWRASPPRPQRSQKDDDSWITQLNQRGLVGAFLLICSSWVEGSPQRPYWRSPSSVTPLRQRPTATRESQVRRNPSRSTINLRSIRPCQASRCQQRRINLSPPAPRLHNPMAEWNSLQHRNPRSKVGWSLPTPPVVPGPGISQS